MRLDKFLKVSRLIKRRTVANRCCIDQRILINNRPSKPGAQVKIGDIISIVYAENTVSYKVLRIDTNSKNKDAYVEVYNEK